MMASMPFGKYRGTPIDELPDSYLGWLASLDDLHFPLNSYVQAELDRRKSERKHQRRQRTAAPARNSCQPISNRSPKRL